MNWLKKIAAYNNKVWLVYEKVKHKKIIQLLFFGID